MNITKELSKSLIKFILFAWMKLDEWWKGNFECLDLMHQSIVFRDNLKWL